MPEQVPMHLTLAEAEADVQRALDVLREVRVANGLSPSRNMNRGAYGSMRRNKSAYCIGASAGTGAKHSSCMGLYHGARCTCDCHS